MENVFTLQKRAALAKILREANSIGVLASERQNLDTMGSALGLMLALTSSNKSASVVSAKDPLVEISNLFGIDRVKKTFGTSIKQLTISFPFIEGEIEKAMYKTEGDRINVHFYAAENKTITFDEKDIKFLKKGGTPEVIFALAVSDEEIGEFINDRSQVKLIRISRHPKDTSGDIVYQDTTFSSVAEIVTKVIQEQGLALDSDAAQNLLDGIVFSTNNYTHPKTSAFAFDATGYLLKKGAKRHEFTQIKEEQDNPLIESKENELVLEKEEEKIEKEVEVQQAQEKNGEPEKINESEENIPSDWFEPMVFRSSKNDE